MLGELCYGAGILACVTAGACGIAEIREERKTGRRKISFVQIMFVVLLFSIAYAFFVAGWVRYLMHVDVDKFTFMLDSLIFKSRTLPVTASVILLAGKMISRRINKIFK